MGATTCNLGCRVLGLEGRGDLVSRLILGITGICFDKPTRTLLAKPL